MVGVNQIYSLDDEGRATPRESGHQRYEREIRTSERAVSTDVARYRRRMVVLILVATAMWLKLVAMSWKGGSVAGQQSDGHKHWALGAPRDGRTHYRLPRSARSLPRHVIPQHARLRLELLEPVLHDVAN